MRTPVANLKGESFFPHDLLIFVNRANEDFNSPLHDHDFLEITYVAEGSGFHHIGGHVLKVRKGDLHIIPVGVPHVFRPSAADAAKHPLAVYNCVVSPRLLDRLEPFVTDRSVADFMQSLHIGEPRHYALQEAEETLDRLFLTLHREFALPRAGSSDLLHILLLQLIIAIYRRAVDSADSQISSPTDEPRQSQAADKASFIRLLAELERQPQEEITLAHLAQMSGYSQRHLQRLFMRHTGQTYLRYRQNRRIEHGCELLKHSGLKIGDIAEKSGYKDVDSFSSVFKRCTGLSPGEYRRRHQV